MLILTRHFGEALMIGDEVKVTVLSGKGNQIRLGIDAPREIAVYREEIYKRIQEGQKKTNQRRSLSNDNAERPTITDALKL